MLRLVSSAAVADANCGSAEEGRTAKSSWFVAAAEVATELRSLLAEQRTNSCNNVLWLLG